ncbi:MAG: PAS domain S-box protein [Spirochaetales bacterium]|nr:PAS domain S-box protein [Spirochaetales bacterium]
MNKITHENTPKVLLVDDNAVIAMNHKKVLQKNGFEVILVFSGEDAVETVRDNHSINMVLMDIDLGKGIDGVDTTRRILGIRDLPVVFLTSHSEREFVKKVKQITNYGYVLKNAEEELHELGTQYRLVAENSTDVIYVLDSQLNFTYFSPSVEKLFGYSIADFKSENLYTLIEQIIHIEDRESIKKQIEARLAGGNSQRLDDFRVHTAAGEIRWVEVRANYVYGEQGEVESVVGIIRDITRRKVAEQAVAQNSIIFELVEELPSVTVVKVDAQLHAEYVSPSMLDVLGYPPHYFIGSSVTEVVHTEDKARLEKEIAYTIEKKAESLFSVYRVYTKNGNVRWLETRARLFYKQKGEFDCAVYIQSDVTERKEKEIELQKALEKNRHLMSELNHRTKNNLAMVSSLIRLKDSSIGAAADLSDIRNQVRAISFIHEKLQNTEDITHINIKPYLEDLLNSIFSFELNADFILNTRLEPCSLPTKMVMNIGLILNELALNAIKHGFSEDKQAVFTVKFVKEKTEDRYIFSVSNTGNIFPEEVDPTHSDSLGLQLVSTIADLMKANMEFSRFPETEFTFLIASNN